MLNAYFAICIGVSYVTFLNFFFQPMCSQVRHHDAVRWGVQHFFVSGGRALLDRLLQLDAEPAYLRVLQPGLPGSLQEHTAVRVLQPVPESAIRLGGAGRTEAIATVRWPHAQCIFRNVPEPLRQAPVQPIRQQLMIHPAAKTPAANLELFPHIPRRRHRNLHRRPHHHRHWRETRHPRGKRKRRNRKSVLSHPQRRHRIIIPNIIVVIIIW